MFSETESSDGSDWLRSIDERGDALALEATSLITTTMTANQDSDNDFDNTKVGEDTIVVNDSWTTRFSNTLRNYMTQRDDDQGMGGMIKIKIKNLD